MSIPWNRASSGEHGGSWSEQTHSTTVAYGSQSPPRYPSPPPVEIVSHETNYNSSKYQTSGTYGHEGHNNKHQANGMGTATYGHEGHYNNHQTNGMGTATYGHEGHYNNHQTNGMGTATYGHEGQYNKYQTNGTGTVTYGQEGQKKKYQTHGTVPGTYGHEGLFGELLPSSFPPGTDPKVMSYFQNFDRDGSGFIDERELKQALSSYSSTFSLRTIRLLMYAFTKTTTKVIGPKEFIAVFYGLQQWKAMFQRFDRNRNGKIDPSELREALRNLGYPVSETVLQLIISRFDKNGGTMEIGFDGFIECCITVKGLSDKFKEKDQMLNGSATFSYEGFMMTVLPYVVA